MNYKEKYEYWLNSDGISEADKKAIEAMPYRETFEAFYRDLEFGTGGMRGIMGLGSNRMNIYTVRMAAKAFAKTLKEGDRTKDKKIGPIKFKLKSIDKKDEIMKVIIAYDTRNNSEIFAKEAARVLAAEGIRTYVFDRPSPVPLLSYAVREMKADGGIVITASHNPKEYNGFKVYDETGCQMLPDKAERIAEHMESLENPLEIEAMNIDDAIIDKGLIIPIGDYIIDKFINAVAGCSKVEFDTAKDKLKVVYTPLHGSGRDYVLKALQNSDFADVSLVDKQSNFDGNFSTVEKPNPEDSKALEMAIEQAYDEEADLVIGTDPDCDRIGVAVVNRKVAEGEAKAVCLTGNQIGALLIDYMCQAIEPNDREKYRVITTIVSGTMGPLIAKNYGVNISLVLTGFKYIGDIMNQMEKNGPNEKFLLGYEESYGYLVGTHTRDKDGVSAALVVCEMANYYKSIGKSLTTRLFELYGEFGFWLDDQESLIFEGAEGEKVMASIMEEFRSLGHGLFETLVEEGEKIGYGDFLREGSGLPKADVLKYVFSDRSWVAIRPSGTEPKIKIYYCVGGANSTEATERQKKMAECIHKVVNKY